MIDLPDASRAPNPQRAAVTRAALALLVPALLALLLGLACQGGGGPNTEASFRAVLIEPPAGTQNLGCQTGGACLDTVRVTFNHAIDTTAVFDTARPRYFLATMEGTGFILDSLGTTVTNAMRTLVIPFQFVPRTDYRFVLVMARDQDGKELENTAATAFSIGACSDPCP